MEIFAQIQNRKKSFIKFVVQHLPNGANLAHVTKHCKSYPKMIVDGE